MKAPAPQIRIKRFPIDPQLAFYRLSIEDSVRTDLLALLVERIQAQLADATSETKVNLTADGGAFIMAFLPDKRPLSKQDVQALTDAAVHEHIKEHQ
ncbi:hypothetical protein [Desulfovibrio ferrophilus]|uniref:Diguanylate cyclase n=1 Tax=Desulfovibrio ferrophilus TaxID=241368 RepID=A0A2Z6B144_9BACT|nr:hypothetical protein [Desulfovibrio ferrophilus]BBD09150.1 diguanylate cyclase [Desulfovibrio ferrophilus]